MIRFAERAALSALILLFACLILGKSAALRADVALVPRMAAVLLIALSALQLAMDAFPAIRRRLEFLYRSSAGAFGGEGVVQEDDEAGDTLAARLRFFGWIAAFIVLVQLTSMIWATAISLLVYLKWIARESWLLSLLYASATALFIYLVFVLGFKLHYFL